MSKWTLLLLSVMSIGVLVFFFRSTEMIRRWLPRNPVRDVELSHLSEADRHERLEYERMYVPQKAVVIAIAVAVYLIFETVRAFSG